MIDVLYGDPFYHVIMPQLSTLDLYYLRLTCKHYHQIKIKDVKTMTIKHINMMLKFIFGDELQDFKHTLQSSDGYISGDFINDIISNKTSDKNIDIYNVDNSIEYFGYYSGDMDNYLSKTMYHLKKYKEDIKGYDGRTGRTSLYKSKTDKLIKAIVINISQNDLTNLYKTKYFYNDKDIIMIDFN